MSEDAGVWPEGQQAWERLARWYRDLAQPLGQGDQALQALRDVGAMRRLLDQLEFEAIRTSRRHGKSWAEIAIRLGITRQSAWERWQDVDQPERPELAGDTARADPDWDIVAEATRNIGATAIPPGGPQPPDIHAAVRRRHQSTVAVPNVVGMNWDLARDVLRHVRLVGVGSDPDAPLPGEGMVTDQSPESGARVPPGSTVKLWVDRGGGSGVREPRRPRPDPKVGRKMLDEAADEAVG